MSVIRYSWEWPKLNKVENQVNLKNELSYEVRFLCLVRHPLESIKLFTHVKYLKLLLGHTKSDSKQ